jgi:hypothetical protein
MADVCTPYTIPVSDDNRGINGKDASYLGDKFNAAEFRAVQVAAAERGERNAHSANGDSRWTSDKFEALAVAVERNGRSAELATEKTAAAGILAIEKTSAAAALALAECCCEMRTAVHEEGEKTRALVSQIDRERLQARLAVLEARSGS